jgi:hypothetical protein
MAGKKGMTGNGLGGPRIGAGRPTKRVTVKADDQFFVTTVTAQGQTVWPSDLWQVVEVSRSAILLRSTETGDTIKLVR